MKSVFLFDERIFDSAYFSEMMRQSRERKEKRLAEIKRLLMDGRSEPFTASSLPEPGDIPGLSEALDSLSRMPISVQEFVAEDSFDMGAYRRCVLEYLDGAGVMFSTLPTIASNRRRDRARRFITLVFMEHEREVALTQYGNDILVEKHEADSEG